jgi:hypothetical protein
METLVDLGASGVTGVPYIYRIFAYISIER